MEKMAEKTINKALHDTGFFKTLKPIEMMHVLISDIIARGDVKKDIFEYCKLEGMTDPTFKMAYSALFNAVNAAFAIGFNRGRNYQKRQNKKSLINAENKDQRQR